MNSHPQSPLLRGILNLDLMIIGHVITDTAFRHRVGFLNVEVSKYKQITG